jgi:hypothetical protein
MRLFHFIFLFVVLSFRKTFFGKPFLENLFWNTFFGKPFLENLFWKTFFGKPFLENLLLENLFWNRFSKKNPPLQNIQRSCLPVVGVRAHHHLRLAHGVFQIVKLHGVVVSDEADLRAGAAGQFGQNLFDGGDRVVQQTTGDGERTHRERSERDTKREIKRDIKRERSRERSREIERHRETSKEHRENINRTPREHQKNTERTPREHRENTERTPSQYIRRW